MILLAPGLETSTSRPPARSRSRPKSAGWNCRRPGERCRDPKEPARNLEHARHGTAQIPSVAHGSGHGVGLTMLRDYGSRARASKFSGSTTPDSLRDAAQRRPLRYRGRIWWSGLPRVYVTLASAIARPGGIGCRSCGSAERLGSDLLPARREELQAVKAGERMIIVSGRHLGARPSDGRCSSQRPGKRWCRLAGRPAAGTSSSRQTRSSPAGSTFTRSGTRRPPSRRFAVTARVRPACRHRSRRRGATPRRVVRACLRRRRQADDAPGLIRWIQVVV